MNEILNEFRRKAFHLTALIFPFFYALTTQENILRIVVPLTAFALILDAQRRRGNSLSLLIEKIFGKLMRPHERNGSLSGLSYMLVGVTITIVLYTKIIAITALLILVLADTASAIFGRIFGRHRCFGIENKSWEGFLAFAIMTWLVIMFVHGIAGVYPNAWLVGIAVGFATALVEVVSGRLRIDDNVLIPISAGIFLTPFYFS
jgi:dolichol kinase